MISRVLTFDYIGALAASLLFPLVLVPKLGLVRSSLLMGCANAGVALWGTWLLRSRLARKEVIGLRIRAIIVLIGNYTPQTGVITFLDLLRTVHG